MHTLACRTGVLSYCAGVLASAVKDVDAPHPGQGKEAALL